MDDAILISIQPATSLSDDVSRIECATSLCFLAHPFAHCRMKKLTAGLDCAMLTPRPAVPLLFLLWGACVCVAALPEFACSGRSLDGFSC